MLRMMARGGLLLSCTLCACSALPDLDFDQCGNGLVEPDNGEDCDSREEAVLGPNLTCGPADTAGACRYLCASDGADCPTGWACGQDGLCRKPTRNFSAGADPVWSASAIRFSVADLDADGRQDVLLHADRRVTALFGDGEGGLVDPSSLEVGPGLDAPLVAPLANDGSPEAVLPLGPGLHIMRTTEARQLESLAHAPYDLSPLATEKVRVVSLNRAGSLTDDVLGLFDGPGGLVITTLTNQPRLELPEARLARLTALPDVADLEGLAAPLRSDELLFAVRGDDRVTIVELRCAGAQTVGCENDRLRLAVRVQIPLPGSILHGARFVDVDGDGRLDVQASVAVGAASTESLVWARQREDGGFDPAEVDGRIALACAGQCRRQWPVAAGNLNDDGAADFVLEEGVLRTVVITATDTPPLAFAYTAALGSVDTIALAELGDFNRDGRTDVVVAGRQVEGVELLLNGQRLLFNNFAQPTAGVVSHMQAGDFDGDLVDDLAVAVDDELGSEVWVLYGSTQGPLQAPISMGRFGFIQQMEAGVLLGGDLGPFDARADLLLQITEDRLGTGPESSAVLLGTSGQRMLAPYVLNRELNSETPLTAAAAHLDDAHPGLDLLALTSSATWTIASGDGDTLAAGASERYELACTPRGWSDCVRTLAAPDGDHVYAFSPAFPCVPAVDDAPATARVLTPGPSGPSCATLAVPERLRAPITVTWADLMPAEGPELLVAFHGIAGPRQSVSEYAGVGIFVPEGDGLASDLEVIEVPLDAGSVYAAHPIDVDDDVALEIAVVTDLGVLIADREATGWALSEEALSLDLPADAPVRALGIADLDGDGLSDLLLGTAHGLFVARGLEGRISEVQR